MNQPATERCTGALILGDLALVLPSGRLYDLRRRALLRSVVLEPLTAPALVHTGGAELLVETALRFVVATALRTGEARWRTRARWMSGSSVVHAGARPLLAMRGVKKHGSGPLNLFDAATGAPVAEGELGTAYPAAAGAGRVFGDPNAPAFFAWTDDATLRIHRASDGAAIVTYAAPPAPPPAATRTETAAGDVVTELALDFSRRPDAVFFGASEVLVVVGAAVRACGPDGAPRFECALPGAGVLLSARQSAGRWQALLRRADRGVDAVELDAGGVTVRWPDCDGIALFDDAVLTATLGIGALAAARVEATLPGAAVDTHAALAPGPVAGPPLVLDILAKLRAAAKDTAPATLSLRAVAALEAELARTIPAWALAVLAARSRTLEKKWLVGLERVRDLCAELAALERTHLAAPKKYHWMSDPEPFPADLVAIGRAETTRRERRGRTLETSTRWWCAAGAQSYLVVRQVTQRLNYDGEVDAAQPAEQWISVEGPFPPEHVLAPVLESVRARVPAVVPDADASIRLIE